MGIGLPREGLAHAQSGALADELTRDDTCGITVR
jgi:hypothetical protein